MSLAVGMSRQNYYKQRRQRKRWQVDEALVIQLVLRERSLQPRLGGRKLLRLIRADLAEAGVEIGTRTDGQPFIVDQILNQQVNQAVRAGQARYKPPEERASAKKARRK